MKIPHVLVVVRPLISNSIAKNSQTKPDNSTRLLPNPNIPKLPSIMLAKSTTSRIFYEKRAKGIYFWYDEKFVSGHTCRRKQTFAIQLHVEIKGIEECEASKDVGE